MEKKKKILNKKYFQCIVGVEALVGLRGSHLSIRSILCINIVLRIKTIKNKYLRLFDINR